MTLNADAAVFTPSEPPAKIEEDEYVEEAGSTVAPSPFASPMLSPYWGFEADASSPEAMWAAAAMYGGYMPEFFLPEGTDADGGLYTEDFAYTRARAMTMPAYINEFTLEGMDDLQSSLEGILKEAKSAQQDVDSQESTSAGEGAFPPPPGLAPPPGLEAPPGLEGLDAGPPGLEPRVMRKTRDRTATWSPSNPKTNPLPDGTTTVMLRNIPNKYTQVALIEVMMGAGFRCELDFVYLPIDFKNKCNVGYAFMNFRTAEACARFATEYHLSNSRDKLPGFNSKKVCEVSPAKFQGFDENVRRLKMSSVIGTLMDNPDWLPKLFDENGEEVDFPVTDTSKPTSQASTVRGRLQRRTGSM